MAEFEERKKFWSIFYSPLVFMILLVVFLFLARAMWRVYNYESISAKERSRVEDELVVTNKRFDVLKNQVEVLQTQQGVDDEIRSKFNVIKAGEGVAVILNGTSSVVATTTSVTGESWWQKFMGVF